MLRKISYTIKLCYKKLIRSTHSSNQIKIMLQTQDQTFDKQDFTQIQLPHAEYDHCIFNNCNFGDQNLSEFKFVDCEFNYCNLSLVKLSDTALRDVKFKECKMLGLRFEDANQFGLSLSFDTCQLNHSSFYGTTLKKTLFKNCQLQETDFTECNLTASLVDKSDLSGATFNRTNLEKADFRTALNYSIDPETNRLKKAKFSISGISGLLDQHDILIENNF